MKTNPYLVVLALVGLLATILGAALTVLTSLDEAQGLTASAPVLGALASVLLAVGAPALAGAGVLAGVVWLTRQRV